MKKILIFILILLISIFINGCGESIKVNPDKIEGYPGDNFKLEVSYSREFSPYHNITLNSNCNELILNSSSVDSGQNGEINALLIIKNYKDNYNNCLSFNSDEYNDNLNLYIKANKQAKINDINFKDNVYYGDQSNLKPTIGINDLSKKRTFLIKSSSTASNIYLDDKDVNQFSRELNSDMGNTILGPLINLIINDNGDSKRTVEIVILLYEKINDQEYFIDSKSISINANRKE